MLPLTPPAAFARATEPLADQDLPGLAPLRRADDPLLFHQVDKPGGAAISNTEPSLQQGDGGLPHLHHQADRLIKERIVRLGDDSLVLLHRLGDVHLVLWLSLPFPKLHQILHVAVVDERSLGPQGLACTHREKEHVASS